MGELLLWPAPGSTPGPTRPAKLTHGGALDADHADHAEPAVRLPLPGDKSVSVRALLLTLLASGPCTVRGLARSRTVACTLDVLSTLGAAVAAVASNDDTTCGDNPRLDGAAAGPTGSPSSLAVTITPPHLWTPAGLDHTAGPRQLDCGGSATLLRLLCGLLCGLAVGGARGGHRGGALGRPILLVGTPALAARPHGDTLTALARWSGWPVHQLARLAPSAGWAAHSSATRAGPAGLRLALFPDGVPPAAPLAQAVETGASAQVQSAVLLAALAARSPVVVTSHGAPRRHTAQLLRTLGVSVEEERKDADPLSSATTMTGSAASAASATQTTTTRTTTLRPGLPDAPVLRPFTLHVPADPSAAAFACALVATTPGARAAVTDVLLDAERTGFVEVLAAFGAATARHPGAPNAAAAAGTAGGLQRGTLWITGAERPRGVELAPHQIDVVLDEIPALAVAAAWAPGPSRFCGLQRLRHKESDRVARLADLLPAFGASTAITPDSALVVAGAATATAPESPPAPALLRTDGDHRIAMAALTLCARAGVVGDEAVRRIDDPGCVAESHPGFAADIAACARALGLTPPTPPTPLPSRSAPPAQPHPRPCQGESSGE